MYPFLIFIVTMFSEARSAVIIIYIGIFRPTNNYIFAICIPLSEEGFSSLAGQNNFKLESFKTF